MAALGGQRSDDYTVLAGPLRRLAGDVGPCENGRGVVAPSWCAGGLPAEEQHARQMSSRYASRNAAIKPGASAGEASCAVAAGASRAASSAKRASDESGGDVISVRVVMRGNRSCFG